MQSYLKRLSKDGLLHELGQTQDQFTAASHSSDALASVRLDALEKRIRDICRELSNRNIPFVSVAA